MNDYNAEPSEYGGSAISKGPPRLTCRADCGRSGFLSGLRMDPHKRSATIEIMNHPGKVSRRAVGGHRSHHRGFSAGGCQSA